MKEKENNNHYAKSVSFSLDENKRRKEIYMSIYERYNRQRAAAYNDDNDPLQHHITNLTRAIGKGLISGLNSYIITMKETSDGRRALLDLKEIDNATKAIEDEIINTVSKDMNKIVSEINKRLK